MKRRALIKHIEKYNCELFQRHSPFNLLESSESKNNCYSSHTEIINKLARKICKDLDLPEPA